MYFLRHLRVFARAGLLLFCCALAAGPHSTLQLGAWGWMITSYSQESSLEQAIRETFGGDRPCELCKIIDASDSNQTQTPLSKNFETRELKLMLGLSRALRIPPNESDAQHETSYHLRALEGFHSKPTPPPREAV